jgi:hypothetical protein
MRRQSLKPTDDGRTLRPKLSLSHVDAHRNSANGDAPSLTTKVRRAAAQEAAAACRAPPVNRPSMLSPLPLQQLPSSGLVVRRSRLMHG